MKYVTSPLISSRRKYDRISKLISETYTSKHESGEGIFHMQKPQQMAEESCM